MAIGRKKRTVKPVESILDSEKFMYREDPEKEDEPEGKMVIDYTLSPRAYNTVWSLVCACLGILFMAGCLYMIYTSGKDPGLTVSAVGACGILWSVAAVITGIKGLREKDRNHAGCIAALSAAGFEIVTWIITYVLSNR